jgi:two-component system, LytTR family, response regulator
MRIKCLAVDDEPLALEKLKSFIGLIPYLQLEGAFINPVKAVEFLKYNPVQILFLDIRMVELSGLEMAEQMIFRPQIIFTTAYNEYALKAFELSVTDYLLKPYTFERFEQAVNKAADYFRWQKAAEMAAKQNIDYIFVKSGYKLVKIMIQDILYLEGMRDFQSIVTIHGRVVASHSLAELENMLPAGFVRCHKSFVVSIPKIESIEKDRIKIGSQLIPIGESYREDFYRKL